MSLAFDISAWQGRPPTIWFKRMKETYGCRLAIIQLWGSGPHGNGPNPFASYQLGQSLEVGLDVAGYIWIPSNSTTETNGLIDSAFSAAGGLVAHLKFAAPDFEGARIHPYAPGARAVNAIYNIAARWDRQQEQPIYCRANNWATVVGGATFPKNPLWEARYTKPSGSPIREHEYPWLDWEWHPFGGWTQRAALQFAGTVDIEGVGTDLNIADYERLGIKEEEMTDQEFKAFLERYWLANLKVPSPGHTMDSVIKSDAELRSRIVTLEAAKRDGSHSHE